MKSLLFVLLFHIAFAAPHEKLTCTARELAQKDCHLYQGSFDFRLLATTIAWTDGTWHSVDPMPLKGEAYQWEKITFGRLSQWPLLQFWLWDKGEGAVQVQSLHWTVGNPVRRKVRWLAEGLVRKRRPEAVTAAEPKAVAKGTLPPAPKASVKFIFDAPEKHSLRALKSGDLEWQIGSEKKILAHQSAGD